MASVSITGSGGLQVTSATSPIAVQAGTPPELHAHQWGLYRFDVRPREEEAQ